MTDACLPQVNGAQIVGAIQQVADHGAVALDQISSNWVLGIVDSLVDGLELAAWLPVCLMLLCPPVLRLGIWW